MLKQSYQATFLPAETSLLSSIQRAKQRIFSKSQKTQSQNNSTKNVINKNFLLQNDENNSLNSNIQPQPQQVSLQKATSKRKISINSLQKLTQQQLSKNLNNSQQLKRQKSFSQNIPPSNIQSTIAVANALRVLQQKIIDLQTKNKSLEKKLNESRIIQSSQPKPIKQLNIPSTISYQSDIKSYLLLKQQCQTLQKENASLYQQLSKPQNPQPITDHKKQSGRKLNFHHEISQNISGVYEASHQGDKQKQMENEQKISRMENELNHYKNSLQNQRKKNFSMLKLYQQEIIKNQELQIQVNNLKIKLKGLQDSADSRNRKSASGRRTSTQNIQNSTNNQIRQSVIRQKNLELQKQISIFKEELQSERMISQQKAKEVTQIQRRYVEVKESFIELYKDLLKYHPEVINSNIKFLYDRIRKGEDTMLRSRSILSNKFGKFSQSRNYHNRLSQFRSKSGKKGLKMQDLNSSKRSHSRDRTISNRSNSKSNYRSPYAQQNMNRKKKIKSSLSPSDRQRNRSTTGIAERNKQKLNQIQNIITQIKQVSRQIKSIKAEHRNLSVKMSSMQVDGLKQNGKASLQYQKNQEKMNRLTEEYNQKQAKLDELKSEKERLALETVPVELL